MGLAVQNGQNAPANQTIDGITIPTTTDSPTPAEVRQIAAALLILIAFAVLGAEGVLGPRANSGAAGQP
jgi:hypothetical protein